MTTAVLSQSHFRGRKDGASIDTAPEWIAAEDTNFTWPVETNFRIRFTVQETAGGNPAADNVKLQANLNGGAFQDVTASSTIVKAVDYSVSAENTLIATKRLSGTGSFVNGRYSNDGSPGGQVDLTASSNTEWEFAVRINAADVANGNTIQLKVVAIAGTAIGLGVTPTVTVSETAVDTKGWFPPLTNDRAEAARFNRRVSMAAVAMVMATIPSPQPSTPSITTTIASAVGETAVIASQLVYDPTAAPPKFQEAAAPAPTFVETPDQPRRSRPSRPADAAAFPAQPPATAAVITTTMACAVGEATVIASQLVYDSTCAPPKFQAQAVSVPVVLSSPAVDPARRPKRSYLLSSFVVAIPDDIFGFEVFDQPRRARPPRLSESNAFPAQPPTAAAVIATTIACALGETSVIASQIVYDMTAMAPRASAVVVTTPTQFGFVTDETVRRLRKPPVIDRVAAGPVRAPFAATPTQFGFVIEDLPRRLRRISQQFDRVAGPAGAPAVAITTPTQFGFVSEDAPSRQRLWTYLPSSFVFAIPRKGVALVSVVGQPPRVRALRLPEAMALPAQPSVAAPSQPPTVLPDQWQAPKSRRATVDRMAVGPDRAPFAATPTPTQFGFVQADAPVRIRGKLVSDRIVWPEQVTVVVTTTPTQFGFVSEDTPKRLRKPSTIDRVAGPDREPFAPTPSQFGFVPDEAPRKIARKGSVDRVAGPDRAPFAGTPTQLGFTSDNAAAKARRRLELPPLAWSSFVLRFDVSAALQPSDVPRRARPYRVIDPLAMGLKEPPPPVPTPSILFHGHDLNRRTLSARITMAMSNEIAATWGFLAPVVVTVPPRKSTMLGPHRTQPVRGNTQDEVRDNTQDEKRPTAKHNRRPRDTG